MKRIAIAAVVIVAVIAAVLVVAPAFVETGFVKGKVTKAVAEATGRRLDLVGSARFSLVPRVAVSISDAALSGPGGEGEMVRLAGLDVGVALLPMLSGRLEVTGVRLREPVITLEVDAAGRPNWDFQKPAGDGATAAPAEPGAPAAGGGFDPAAFWLGRVDIENGTLVYRDAASGRDERVEAIDLSARLPSPTDESEITGSVRYKGETVTIDAGIDGPGALLADGAAPLRLALAGDKAKLEAKGTLAPKAVTAFEGDVSAAIPSLDALFDWLGLAAAPRGLGAASLDTRLFAGEKAIAAEGLRLGLAGGTLTADASLSLFGARPRIDARGVVDRLDLDRLTSAAAPAPAAGSGKADAAKADAADAPIDLSALAALDAAVELDIGELVVSGAEARNVGLGVELVDRRLELSLFDAKALGGRARARLVADATRKTPAFAGTVMLDGLDLEAIGKVAARPLPASGAASLDMSFSARGATRAALAKSLDGKGTLRLADGRVAGLGLKDAVGGDPAADVVEKINIRADFASLAAPVKATGSLVWRGERFDVKAGLSPRAFLEDGRTEASVDVVAKRLEAGFSGTVAAGAKTALAGRVRLKTASLRDLLAWVGQPLAPGAGLGRFAIDGVLEAGPETVTFSDATIALDGSSGTGEGRVVFGAKPNVTGRLALSTLDVNPYLGASVGGSAPAGGGGGGGKAAAAGGGWDTTPIDFSGLRALDADLRISAEKILAGDMTIDASALGVTIAGGVLDADLSGLSLYKGAGKGRLELDGTREKATLTAVFDLGGLDAYPFLRDAAGFERIEGTGAISFDVATAGASQLELVEGLSGKAAFAFTDGAVRGINVAKLIRGVTSDVLLGWQDNKTEKTDFASLTANYTIANGIARNDDLKMVGPLVRLTGGGTVDLPRKTLSYKVEPMLVSSLKGQGGREDLQGMKVPVVIEGPWSKPRIYPDIAGILENPEAGFAQLRELGGGLFAGEKTEEAVRKLIENTGDAGLDLEGLVRGDGKIDQEKALGAAAKALGKALGGKKTTAPAEPAPAEATPAPAPAEEQLQVPDEAVDLLKGLLGR